MRKFYLSRNNSGYYKVTFVDQETGALSTGKSTHTKDKDEAIIIASQWLKDGVPKLRSNCRNFNSSSAGKVPLDIIHLAKQIEESEALQLIELLSKKFDLNLPQDLFPLDQKSTGAHKSSEKPKIPLISFLYEFWDYETSEFVKRYLAHGHNITKRHTDMMKGLVKNYWLPYFGEEMTVQELDYPILDDFFFYLHTEKGLKGATVNKAINCGRRAVRYLFEKKKIDTNPFIGIERFNPNSKERGIPTESEVRQLLYTEWENKAFYLAFKLGVFCGLRAGEISGLRVCDLDLEDDIIHVRHSWNDVDGLKCPKNADVRSLPIDHETVMQLYIMARENPQFSDMSFVFWSPVKPEQPLWPSYYVDGFREALVNIGISIEQQKDRNLVFHSLRHFCATVLSQRCDLKMVQAVMGHRTEIMSKHYSDHETQEKLQNMRDVMQVTWNDIRNA